ncbi:MAG: hypothetical protein IPO86_08485 [Saprospiraceae bacterium]|nr:hypothetical protein [Saprospiraceae bacterium]
MSIIRQFIIIIIFVLPFQLVSGQAFKKILGLPEHFKRPLDKSGTEYDDYLIQKSSYNKEIPWVVTSDREDNVSYNKAAEGSGEKEHIKFRDVFYVVEDVGDWIHLINLGRSVIGTLDIKPGTAITDRGWIKKNKMLLWRTSLRNPQNGIHLKSLLLYSDKAVVDIAKGDVGKTVKFLDGPSSTSKILSDKLLYEFFFVLKKENGYYLLGTEADLKGIASGDSKILGWIPETKQAPWNTRLCLEPNFTSEAFKERKNRTNYRVNCYRQSLSAVDNFNSGNVTNSELVYDPVVSDPKEIAKDGFRFKGYKMRLPVLEVAPEYFSTGVLGSLDASGKKRIDDSKLSEIQSAFSNFKKKRSNWNFFFLIEASESMRAWRPALTTALDEIKKNLNGEENVRFGIAFYRDPKLNGEAPYFNLKTRTSDLQDVYKFINQQEFIAESPDQHTSLNYALKQGLLKSGFADGETNILYVFANNPDFSSDVMLNAECNECPERVTVDEISQLMENKGVHFISIQPSSNDAFLSRDLHDRIEDIMLETSKRIFESMKVLGKYLEDFVKFDNPTVIETSTERSIKNGPYTCRLIYPETNSKSITKQGLIAAIVKSFSEINDYEKSVVDYLNKLLLSGDSASDLKEDIAAGKFGNGIIDKINEILKNSGYSSSSENVINEIVQRKIRIYTQVYVSKKPAGAIYESFSPVLFFPREELKDYINELQNLSVLINKPDPEMRRELRDHLMDLFSKYSGTKKVPKDLDLNDICKALTGNGFSFERKDNFEIRDLLSDNIQSDMIRSFIQTIGERQEYLDKIINNPKIYSEYIYTTANNENYFWIPFKDVF